MEVFYRQAALVIAGYRVSRKTMVMSSAVDVWQIKQEKRMKLVI
jgi:uncharacterized protein (DUF2384 family)